MANTDSDATARLMQEKQFRLLVEEVKEYAIFLLDPEGYVATWNAGAERIKGYAPNEILGEHFSIFYVADDVEAGIPEAALETTARDGDWTSEGWRVRKDGSRFWAHVTITALRGDEDELLGFAKITRDVTQRRQLQQDVLRMQEDERRHIGQELHDRVASQLSGIAIMLTMLTRKLDRSDTPGDDELVQDAREVQRLIQESCEDVRRLSQRLSPVHLSEVGLAAALGRLARNTKRCRFEGDEKFFGEDAERSPLSEDTEIHLYWIAQEAVTNACKYAEAEQIVIRLERDGSDLVLAVEDDGVGFDPSALTSGGLGLRTMRYRAELIGGEATIDAAPGEGTRIRCRKPV